MFNNVFTPTTHCSRFSCKIWREQVILSKKKRGATLFTSFVTHTISHLTKRLSVVLWGKFEYHIVNIYGVVPRKVKVNKCQTTRVGEAFHIKLRYKLTFSG